MYILIGINKHFYYEEDDPYCRENQEVAACRITKDSERAQKIEAEMWHEYDYIKTLYVIEE